MTSLAGNDRDLDEDVLETIGPGARALSEEQIEEVMVRVWM